MRFAGPLLIVAGLARCTPYLQATAGFASPLVDPASGERGGVLNLDAGFNLLENNRPYALATGINLRSRFTERTQQTALGHEVTLRYFLQRQSVDAAWTSCADAGTRESCGGGGHSWLTPMEVYFRLGGSAVTFGARDGKAAIGTTALAEYGLVMMLGAEDVPYVTLGTAVAHDARVKGEPGPLTVSFLIGVGYLKVKPRGTGGGVFFGR